MIRNSRSVLLAAFGILALVVAVIVLRTGDVPPELWALLGLGLGGILQVVSRTEDPPDDKGK